jgi:hypothetical protein
VTRFPQNTAAITDTTPTANTSSSSFLFASVHNLPQRPTSHRLNILAFNVPDMQSWKNFSANLPSVDVSAVSKNLRNTVQATRWVGDGLGATPSLRVADMCSGRDLGTSVRMESPSASLVQPTISQYELAADDPS